MDYMEEYLRWCNNSATDKKLSDDLKMICDSEATIKDAFSCNLKFEFGRMEGIIGAGPNRMNTHTIAKATQALTYYLMRQGGFLHITIAYDSHPKSKEFAEMAACVCAANVTTAYIWPEPMPSSVVPFVAEYLHLDGGILITTSNALEQKTLYSLYGNNGTSLSLNVAKEIQAIYDTLDVFDDVHFSVFSDVLKRCRIQYLVAFVYDAFMSREANKNNA